MRTIETFIFRSYSPEHAGGEYNPTWTSCGRRRCHTHSNATLAADASSIGWSFASGPHEKLWPRAVHFFKVLQGPRTAKLPNAAGGWNAKSRRAAVLTSVRALGLGLPAR